MNKQQNTSELHLRTNTYRTTMIGTEVIRPSTKEEWQNYGEILRRVDEAKQWAIGDWLLDGMNHFEEESNKNTRHYGTGLYEQAKQAVGLGYNYLAQQKRMAELFEFRNRFLNLSYAHHYTVASIKQVKTDLEDKQLKQGRMQWSDEPDMDKMQELLHKAAKEELSVSELQEQVKIYKSDKEREFALHNSPEKYDVFYADPPWNYNDKLMGKGAEGHYPCMTIKELCALPIKNIASDNAVLFLWVTAPLLMECASVIQAWGFEYKTSFVWDKVDHNYGHYNSVRHELLLVCTKGSYLPENNKLFDSVQTIKRSEVHSQKPEEFRNIIEAMYLKGRKIELFAREHHAKNWDVWGNEVDV